MMLNNNEKVEFADELIIRLDKLIVENEGKYAINKESCQRFLKVYGAMRKFAWQNDGGIAGENIEPDLTHGKVFVVVPMVDLYRDSLEKFKDMLLLVDAFDVTRVDEDTLMITATVSNLWKAVTSE